MFSTVLRAYDNSAPKTADGMKTEVAIKMIRSNETMYKAGQLELQILNKLCGRSKNLNFIRNSNGVNAETTAAASITEKSGKKNVVQLLRHFEYRGHLCLVFEALALNLREVIKKFGRNIGLNIRAVRSYTYQMLVALRHLRNNGVLHADIKPDNMLISSSRATCKLCDFGSAMFAGENDITPYLVSRFYRSPEIILGLPYDHALDMWSVGATVYELFTGSIAFAGRSNNEMLKLMMEMKGAFPKRMLKKGLFAEKHFDLQSGSGAEVRFRLVEKDPVTGQDACRLIHARQTKDIVQIINQAHTSTLSSYNPDDRLQMRQMADDRKRVQQLGDLLEKMFILDPEKRITVQQALTHPFFKELPASKDKDRMNAAGGNPQETRASR